MYLENNLARASFLLGFVFILSACGEPRAVMLPLQYPDGSAVVSRSGEPVMAGYQTYGTAMHANATALYDRASPATCTTCAHVGMVVSEPSNFRQFTGLLGASTEGAGAVMGGLGMMNYGNAAEERKLGTNINQNSAVNQGASIQNQNSSSQNQNNFRGQRFAGGDPHKDGGNNQGGRDFRDGGGHYGDGRSYASGGGQRGNGYANSWNQYGGY